MLMPAIAETDLTSLAQKAGRWLQVPRPSALPRDLRLRDVEARAAFTLATFRNQPLVEACHRCGTWTASWCEGCYLREEKSEVKPIEYNALCSECDQLHLVCDQCNDQSISWSDGNTVATSAHGHIQEETIQVTGFWDHNGVFVYPEGNVDIGAQPDGPPDLGSG